MAERARSGKVTVVGAGFYGSTTALRLAEYDLLETVVLTDIVEGKPEGIALDMNQSRPIEGFETRVVGVGGGSYEGTEDSDVVVVTAGLLRLFLPLRRIGFLAVRSRPVDVTLSLGSGVLLTVIALAIPYT